MFDDNVAAIAVGDIKFIGEETLDMCDVNWDATLLTWSAGIGWPRAAAIGRTGTPANVI